jgi:cysteinyl-tRNA synthetase
MKRSTPAEIERGITWKSPWGAVRPGWHIECSVLSTRFLGGCFDIHTGGIDLMFPHHENEIAQTEAATGKRFVNYWIHCEHLLVEGQKMAKSLRNFITLDELSSKGYIPQAIRLILISTHHRRHLNFTMASLEAAEKTVESILTIMRRLKDADGGIRGEELSSQRELFEAGNTPGHLPCRTIRVEEDVNGRDDGQVDRRC